MKIFPTVCGGLFGVSQSSGSELAVASRRPWHLTGRLGEETLYQSLFLEKSISSQSGARRAPDWEEMYRELSKRGVSLRLLWQEYREKNPGGYGKNYGSGYFVSDANFQVCN